MANVCSKCSTDNADGALVCRHCGASLGRQAGWSRSLIPDEDNFDPLSAPTLVMRHTVPSELPPLDSILIAPEPQPGRVLSRKLAGLAAIVALIGVGVWLLRPTGETAAPLAASAPAPAPAPAPMPAVAPPPPAAPAVQPVAAPSPAPAASVIAAAPAAASQAASAPDRRKRIPEPVGRKQAMEAAPAASPAAEPEVVVAAPPPPAPASAPEPVKLKSVTELCGAGSLITRGFCEHRECAKAEHAGDAVCARLKEAEEARRFRQ
ncbi:MAG: hypothetical protein JSR75_16450 [Proteobacteria bacterium]|nr:hypothetical protein [Pseudomonadota bacterium]